MSYFRYLKDGDTSAGTVINIERIETITPYNKGSLIRFAGNNTITLPDSSVINTMKQLGMDLPAR